MKNKFKIQNGKLGINRIFNSQFSTFKSRVGMTLVELLIYMGILSIFLAVLSGLFV